MLYQNGLENYTAFTIKKKLVFIDDIEFINSSPDAENCQIMILDIYQTIWQTIKISKTRRSVSIWIYGQV